MDDLLMLLSYVVFAIVNYLVLEFALRR